MGVDLNNISTNEKRRVRKLLDAGMHHLVLGMVNGCPPGKDTTPCGYTSSCVDCIKDFVES